MKDREDSGDINVTETERRRIARIVAARDFTKRIESAAVVATQPQDVIAWDVAGMMPCDDAPTLIFGPPASFKSWLGLHLCDSVARGSRFLGCYDVTKRPKALYVNVDAGPKTFRNRVRMIGGTPGFDFITLSAIEFSDIGLRELLAEYRGGFVVLDCLAAIYNPPAIGDPAFAMRAFVDELRKDYADFGCGGAVLDHPHRPKEVGGEGDYYGNIQKEAAFRSMWQVNVEAKEPGQPGRTKIACRKISEGEPFSVVHAVIDFSGEQVAFTAANDDPARGESPLETKIIAWALGRGDEPFTMRTVVDSINGTDKQVRLAANALISRKIIGATGATRKRGDLLLHADYLPSAAALIDAL